jgi:hypothetical protein
VPYPDERGAEDVGRLERDRTDTSTTSSTTTARMTRPAITQNVTDDEIGITRSSRLRHSGADSIGRA